MASKMFLFWGSGCVPCWKAMLALEEKGFSGYQNKLISFSGKEHKSDDVIKLNPRGEVPTFKDGDVVLNESAAICQYLERTYGNQGTQLIPSDAGEQAIVLQRMYEIGNIHQIVLDDLAYYIMFKTKEEDQDKELIKEGFEKARTELNIWEGFMKQNGSGAFIASKNFSMADVFFFPYIALVVRIGLNLDKFPALSEYYNRVKDRDSVKKTWPPHWISEASKFHFMNAI